MMPQEPFCKHSSVKECEYVEASSQEEETKQILLEIPIIPNMFCVIGSPDGFRSGANVKITARNAPG
jgi:hypothetical protein